MYNYIAAGKPTRRYLALLCGLVTACITATAQAQQPPQPADAATAQKLDKVVVTGSSIKRIEGETALPILLISREDIKRAGVSSVEELLKTISTTSTSGSTSVANTAAGGGQGGGGSTSLISLRGLGSARTLVFFTADQNE